MLHFTIKKREERTEWMKKGIRNMEVRVAHTRTRWIWTSFAQWFMVFSLPKNKKKNNNRKTSWGNNSHLWTSWAQMMCNWNRQWTRARKSGEDGVRGTYGACCKCAAQYKSIWFFFFGLIWFGQHWTIRWKIRKQCAKFVAHKFRCALDRSNNHLSCAFDFLIVNNKRRSS